MKKYLLTFIYCLLSATLLFAGNKDGKGSITGKVTTSDGQPAASVTIALKGSGRSTMTNEAGRFILRNINEGGHELEISLTGYESITQYVTVKSNGIINVTLELAISKMQLQEVVVSGGRNKLANKESDNVARMPLKNLENSQVYTVVPKELLEEQIVVDYKSAMKNIPGTNASVPPNGATFIRMRGFYTGSYVRNGLASQQYIGMDPVNIERIEAIRGPSGTLFGSSLISFGGLTNRVTKKPFDTFKGEISYSTGSWDLNRLTADVNTPLNKDKTALMRVNAAVTSLGSFQDYGFEKSYAVAPSFSFKINDQLTLLLDAELYNANRIAATYPVFGTISAKNFKDLTVGYKNSLATNDDMARQNARNIFAQAVYKINDSWTSTTLFAASDTRWDTYSSVTANWLTDTTIRRTIGLQRPRVMTSKNFQQNITGDFNVGRFRNRILAGIDVYYATTRVQNYSAVVYDTVNTSNPQNKPIRAISMERTNAMFAAQIPSASVSDQLQYAAYAADVFNITGNLNAMLSLRVDRFENKGSSTNGAARTGKYSQTALSPKLGLVYEIVKDRISLFGNYMNGFQNLAPVTQPDATPLSLKPQQANQWETGVKLDILSHKLVASVSYYDIQVSNSTRVEERSYANSNDELIKGNFTVQDGTQRSKGVDVELIANPVQGLNILLGYGYNDIRFIEAAAAVKGKRATMAPQHMGNFWLSYKFRQDVLKGLGTGIGGNYVGKCYWDNVNTIVSPEFTTLDATVFYDRPSWRLGLKVNNLANQKGWSINGEPIALSQFIGSLTFRF